MDILEDATFITSYYSIAHLAKALAMDMKNPPSRLWLRVKDNLSFKYYFCPSTACCLRHLIYSYSQDT